MLEVKIHLYKSLIFNLIESKKKVIPIY